MNTAVPIVDYLRLGAQPALVAHECASCAARYFDRRNSCAKCFGTAFVEAVVPNEGSLLTFSIVCVAAPGIDVPFVAAIVDCDGTLVAGNIVNTPPTPEAIKTGMRLRLVTGSIGRDSEGTEAIGFGFEPVIDRADISPTIDPPTIDPPTIDPPTIDQGAAS